MGLMQKNRIRPAKKKALKFTKKETQSAAQLAKMITLRCIRNTCIEHIHAGPQAHSKSGDYSDVTVVTPDREILWNEVSRISDEEMKTFNEEVINKLYTVLLYLGRTGEMPVGPHAFYSPHNWDDPKLDPFIVKIFESDPPI